MRYPLICYQNPAAGFRATLVGNGPKGQEVAMSEKIKSEMISRRGAFMLLGSAAAAFSVAVPVTIMTATDAEARVGNPASAVTRSRQLRRHQPRLDKEKKNKVVLRGYRTVAPFGIECRCAMSAIGT